MVAKSRLFFLPLIAVLLPCAAAAGIGYKWLQLEQDADARRSVEAAHAEADRLRRGLTAHVHGLAVDINRQMRPAESRPPFADPARFPGAVLSAYRFGQDGKIVEPDYEGAYRRALRDGQEASRDPAWLHVMDRVEGFEAAGDLGAAERALRRLVASSRTPAATASALLRLGRLSLQRRDYRSAASWADQLLTCCSAARDEYGVSMAIYAARQLTAAWRGEGTLARNFPALARQIIGLLDAGMMGHPADLADLKSLLQGQVESPDAATVVQRAEAAAAKLSSATILSDRLQTWVAALDPSRRSTNFSLATLWSGDRLHLLGVLPRADRTLLVVLYRLDAIGTWIAADAASAARFDAALLVGTEPTGERLGVPLAPDTPGLRLALRPREADPSTAQRRRTLLAASLAAALVILGVVAFFGLRDISREVRLASTRAGFVAAVTHELKTPLTSIRLLAETLALKRARDPAVADQLLQGIIDESDRLGHLVANVLAVARIDQGAPAGGQIETGVGEAADAAVGRIGHLLRQRGFHVVREGDADSLYVRVDPDDLQRALVNLIENAVKYSGHSREIRFGVFRADGQVEFRIVDRGIGIDPADQRRIFERFYRGAAAAREAGGAGIGLALVQHFADTHAGRVTVVSERGRGSTFSLWLPMARADDGAGEAPTVLADSQGEDAARAPAQPQ